jgi:general L-amino acid transport system permease protein
MGQPDAALLPAARRHCRQLLRAPVGVALPASAHGRGGARRLRRCRAARGRWPSASPTADAAEDRPAAGLRLVIPGIVGSYIALFKDTSLVLIIGLFDLLGIIQLNFTDADWATPETPATGYVFAGAVYWVFCFGMSRYSQYMERRLRVGHGR